MRQQKFKKSYVIHYHKIDSWFRLNKSDYAVFENITCRNAVFETVECKDALIETANGKDAILGNIVITDDVACRNLAILDVDETSWVGY